jgi:Protein of unknown function (DUF3489)
MKGNNEGPVKEAATVAPQVRTHSKKPALKPEPLKARKNTKTARILALLQRPNGATLETLMKATGWQAHSVRGFLSGQLRKRMHLRLKSSKQDGERVYKLPKK